MTNFQTFPIADADCASLNMTGEALASFTTADEAKADAQRRAGDFNYGVGILDAESGAIDVGFGFGVPAPEDR